MSLHEPQEVMARIREALAEAQRLARVGSWVLTPADLLEDVSEAFAGLLQLPEGTTRCGLSTFIQRTHAEDRERLDAALQRSRMGLATPLVEHRLLLPDGSLRWVATRVKTRPTPGSRLQVVLGSTQDVTEQRQAALALRQTQHLESMGVLAISLAHDLTRILAQANALAGRLAQEVPPELAAIAKELGSLIQQADRLALQATSYEPSPGGLRHPMAVNPLIESVVPLVEAMLPASAKLVLDLQTPLPAIDGDEGAYRQAFLAVVTNAAEALEETSGGTLLIATGTTRMDRYRLEREYRDQPLEPGIHVALDIQDTGHGMSAETLARAFEPFFTTRATGRGLGLTAARDILFQHGAGIRLASTSGDGTTVRILFPVSNAHLQADVPTAGVPVSAPLVLVVDDDPILRMSAVEALEGRGYRAIQARDGVEAVELFRQRGEEVALVVLDVAMPRKDGLEALAEILQLRADARVVLCSGYHLRDVLEGEVGRQAAAFLPKPYRVRELLGVVTGLLSPGPSRSGAPAP